MAILAYRFPVFQAAMRIISAITTDEFAKVTTTFPHQYRTGLICRLHIPTGFGMVEANNLSGFIVVLNSTQFTIDVDTRKFNTFVVPSTYPLSYQSAQIIPIGNFTENIISSNLIPVPSAKDFVIVPDPTRNVLPYPLTNQ